MSAVWTHQKELGKVIVYFHVEVKPNVIITTFAPVFEECIID